MSITRRVLCSLFLFSCVINGNPDVRIQVYEPHGIRVTLSVPEPNYIKFVVFDGLTFRGRIALGLYGQGVLNKDGNWIYEHAQWQAYINDHIKFDVFMSNSLGYTNSTPLPQLHENTSSIYLYPGTTVRKRIVVEKFDINFEAGTDCQPSVTKLRNGIACSGQTIFEDNFDTLNTEVWQIEHYIPKDHPEHPFVSYQRLTTNPTVYVDHGKLYIQPRLQHTLPGFDNDVESLVCGTLDLSYSCTRQTCVERALGDVVSPVASGRITSARFAFTYGTVTIRAKLPLGDWLYPEILLEPYANKYGSMDYASGVIKIAMALGNRRVNLNKYNSRYLKGFPIFNEKCRTQIMYLLNPKHHFWGDDFHEYSVTWTPDSIKFAVDGHIYGSYDPGQNGFQNLLPDSCYDVFTQLSTGSRIAPFDDHFYITLGMAAGGTREFPDGMTSNGKPKPWRNGSRKAVLTFLRDIDTWFPTWNNSALIVDYIKVVAL